MVVHLDEFAIQAVTDAHRGFQRLDVNIRGTQAERLGEGLENQPDDRGVIALETRLRVARGDG